MSSPALDERAAAQRAMCLDTPQLRIIHLMTHLRLGAGRAIVDLAIRQARGLGHDVIVAVADDAEGTWRSDPALLRELESAGVATVAVGDFFHRSAEGLALSAGRLRSLAVEWTASTVVHAHTAPGVAVARDAGAPRTIVTCHGWNLQRPVEYDLQDALAFTLADTIVSPSTQWATRVAAFPGLHDVRVIPYGFDLTRYPRLRSTRRAQDPIRIACVGELTHRKGQDVLLEAMPLVWRSRPDAELHLLGVGDLADALRDRARHLESARERIVFHGHVAWPYAELARYDLFCLPSRSDNQPVAIIEAMLAELPIVATGVGGIPEMIAGAECGYTVPPDSAGALAEALVGLATRADRTDAGARGRNYACREYDVTVAAERIDAVYRGTRGTSAGPAAHHADGTGFNDRGAGHAENE